MKIRILFILLAILLLSSSCSSITGPGFYTQLISGEVKILAHRTPINDLIIDPSTAPELKANLTKINEIKEFATNTLKLPVSESYTSYVDLKRRYATWAITATLEFSANPKIWCFPFAGCTSYIGFFRESDAVEAKNILTEEGYDVSLRGVTAFSTLGWFADPLLNTHLYRTLPEVAGIIFHETSHEKLYIKNDTAFNEAFATFVGHTGQYLWVAKHYSKEDAENVLIYQKRADELSELIVATHKELNQLYSEKHSPQEMKILKKETFARMRERYAELKNYWGGFSGYDTWIASPLNNADIAGENEYKRFIPFFQKLFIESNYDFDVFYQKVDEVAKLPKKERYLKIEETLSK